MKHRIFKSISAIIIIFALAAPTAAGAFGSVVYTNVRRLADNLEYINTVTWSSSIGRTESFAVRMTGQGDAYPIVLSGDTIFGSTRISALVEYIILPQLMF